MSEWEPTPEHIRSVAAHERKRRELGKAKHAELLQISSRSNVPISFHLGLLLMLQGANFEYPAKEIISRLAGLNYPDFKSSRYAILYAQSISLIKLAVAQENGYDLWPANLYQADLNRLSVPESVCADLATEEVTDNGLWINPPLQLQIQDALTRIKRALTGTFNPNRIAEEVEQAFTNQNQVADLNNLVAMKFQQFGMPSDW